MTPSRWAAGATLLLAGGALAGCGSATASSPTAGSSRPVDAVRLSADHVTCTDSASLRTCTMLVTYTNGSSSPLDLDASETRVVDAAGQVWRATTVGAPPVRTSVSPGGSASYTWTVTVPTTVVLSSVRWTGDLGDTATAVIAGSAASPSPTSTPTAKPTTPPPTPTKKPSPSSGQTSRPNPGSSQPSGSIG